MLTCARMIVDRWYITRMPGCAHMMPGHAHMMPGRRAVQWRTARAHMMTGRAKMMPGRAHNADRPRVHVMPCSAHIMIIITMMPGPQAVHVPVISGRANLMPSALDANEVMPGNARMMAGR